MRGFLATHRNDANKLSCTDPAGPRREPGRNSPPTVLSPPRNSRHYGANILVDWSATDKSGPWSVSCFEFCQVSSIVMSGMCLEKTGSGTIGLPRPVLPSSATSGRPRLCQLQLMNTPVSCYYICYSRHDQKTINFQDCPLVNSHPAQPPSGPLDNARIVFLLVSFLLIIVPPYYSTVLRSINVPYPSLSEKRIVTVYIGLAGAKTFGVRVVDKESLVFYSKQWMCPFSRSAWP